MVHKKSEYQNEFRPSIVKHHESIYLENLTFRHNRRDREFLHTPICWGEVEEEETSSEDDSRHKKSITNVADEPQYQSLAEILTESSKKTEAFRQKKDGLLKETDHQRDASIKVDNNKSVGTDTDTIPRIELSSTKLVDDDQLTANKDCYSKDKKLETYSKFSKGKVIEASDKEYDKDDCLAEIAKEKFRAMSGIRKEKASKSYHSSVSKQKAHKSTG